MNKNEFTKKLAEWLKVFIHTNLVEDYEIVEIIEPETTLNRENNANIKAIPNSSSWEFTPNLIAVLKHKNSGKLETILVNRTTSSISLREIGELKVYSMIADPLYSFMASLRGSSSEVGLLMLDNDTRGRCLSYNDRSIIIFGWNDKTNEPAQETIIPIDARKIL